MGKGDQQQSHCNDRIGRPRPEPDDENGEAAKLRGADRIAKLHEAAQLEAAS